MIRSSAMVLAVLLTLICFGFTNCSSKFQSDEIAINTADIKDNLDEGRPSAPVQPSAATSGDPTIYHVRNGAVIATYTKLADAFKRTHSYRKYESGDIFELEPAIYEGSDHHAWIGPLPKDHEEYLSGSKNYLLPMDITIRGKTVNNRRPVVKTGADGPGYNVLGQGVLYVDEAVNITIENIDFDGGGPGTPVGKAGIYLNGVRNFTLRNSRVKNFNHANGVFGTGNNSGTITFENVETAFNGGGSGPEHNYYMGSSDTDPNFTVIWRGCYTHNTYYGHTLKSRAQNNIVEGCHFKGKQVTGNDQGEAYLADFPNGGRLVFRNNVMEKGYSGDNSNGMFITYAMEGQKFSNGSIEILHNTLIAHSEVFDSQGHALYPFSFYYPQKIPGQGFPVPFNIKANVFIGFRARAQLFSDAQKYRGDDYLELSKSELNSNFTLKSPLQSDVSATSQLTHAFPVGTVLRSESTYGAFD